jgi:hypothetical protein
VYLVGRRGPAQAACTAKELREVLGNFCIKSYAEFNLPTQFSYTYLFDSFWCSPMELFGKGTHKLYDVLHNDFLC